MNARNLEGIEDLHRRIDVRAKHLAARHRDRLQCRRGCWGCCVDGITVFTVEAELIRDRASALLAAEAPAPPGRCAFLDRTGACRIYPWRPYVCRTQGLPLRWQEETDTDELLEYRDICPLNEEGPPLEQLIEEDCWTIGEVEGELAGLQQATHGKLARVSLRDLFVRPPDS